MAIALTRNRIAFAVVAAVLLWISGRAVLRALESDETKIRRLCAGMVESFNEQRTSRFLAGLTEDFVDQSSGVRRDEVREALIYAYFQELDPETKAFLLHAELEDPQFPVEVRDTQPPSASATLTVKIARQRSAGSEVYWNARVEGELVRGASGWQWSMTRSVNHADRKRR